MSIHAEALAAARAEVLRLERLIAAEECAVFGHRWCDTGEDDGAEDPLVLYRCCQCDTEVTVLLSLFELLKKKR